VLGGDATYGYDDAQRAAALDRARAFMGFADATWFADDGPPVAVRVSPFCIDRTEVPADVQARCVAAGACPPARPSASAAADPSRWPAVTPAAVDAEALCAWRGGRLPTDVEWEAAARGGDRRVFPWGDAWTGREANYLGSEHPAGPASFPSDGFPGPAPIGAFDGRSPFGPVDMAGNLAEWVSDCFTMDAHARVSPGAVDPVAPPVEGNLDAGSGGNATSAAAGVATGVLVQYPDDGHFAVYDNDQAFRTYGGFLRTLVNGPGVVDVESAGERARSRRARPR